MRQPSKHDAAVRQYRDAVEVEAREERDREAEKDVAYAVEAGRLFRAAEALRALKVKANHQHNSK